MFEGQYAIFLLPTTIKMQPFLFLTAHKVQRKAKCKLNENNPCNASRLHKRNVFATTLLCLDTLLYIGGKSLERCKYFSQTYLSLNSLFINTLRNLLFGIPKAAVLHGKSVGFASQKSRFRNAKAQVAFFNKIIFTKSQLFCNDDILQR